MTPDVAKLLIKVSCAGNMRIPLNPCSELDEICELIKSGDLLVAGNQSYPGVRITSKASIRLQDYVEQLEHMKLESNLEASQLAETSTPDVSPFAPIVQEYKDRQQIQLIDVAIELLRLDDDKPSRGHWVLKAGEFIHDRLSMADALESAFVEELGWIERHPKQQDEYLQWPRKSSNERIAELEAKVVDLNSTIARMNQENIDTENTLAHHRSRNDELDGVVARQGALLLEKDHRILALTQEIKLCKENTLVLTATPAIQSDTPLNDDTAKWFTDSIMEGIEMAKRGEDATDAPDTVGATITIMARDAYIANHTKMPEPIGPDTPADARNVGWFQVEVNNGYNDACAAFDNGQPRPTKTGIGTVGAYLYNVGVNSGWNKKRLDKLQGVFSDFNHAAQHV